MQYKKEEKRIPRMVKDGTISKNNWFKRCLGDLSGGPVVKHPPSNAGDTGLIPGGIHMLQSQLSLHATTRENSARSKFKNKKNFFLNKRSLEK